jgi:hypothetical protein
MNHGLLQREEAGRRVDGVPTSERFPGGDRSST